MQFTRDNDLKDDGGPAAVAGTTSYVSPKEDGDDSCVVRTPHRTYTNSVGDRTIELFRLAVSERQRSGTGGTTKLCGTARELSAAVVKNIARSLPGK